MIQMETPVGSFPVCLVSLFCQVENTWRIVFDPHFYAQQSMLLLNVLSHWTSRSLLSQWGSNLTATR